MPKVGIVISNYNGWQDTLVCLDSLQKQTFTDFEVILIDDASPNDSVAQLQNKLPPNTVFLPQERNVGFAAANNIGMRRALDDGCDFALLLNNDTEVITPNWLEEMVMYAQQKRVGCVGAKLLYPDDTIQHAGVVIGFGGVAGHTFIGLHEAENSYFHRAMCAQDYSAVTAACMMSKKSVFDAVGGFSEDLAVAFNDIDYCMKVRSLGKLVVYAPYALLYHYESKSRGLEDTPEKVARFNREVAKFAKKWPEILKNGDPYYNPNLTLRKSNFALRDLKKEGIGQPYELDPAIRELMKEAPEQETTSEAQKG